MDKSQLRKNTIQYLTSISISERQKIEKQLTTNLISNQLWQNAEVIGTTISQSDEWNTRPIIEAAWDQGKQVCVPKCDPTHKQLDFYILESYDQLEVVFYNLQEPIPEKTQKVDKKNIDLLIVPGLVFEPNGYRVGFGGGYYDRFLADFANQTVSLLSKKQLVEELPIEEFDIPVDHLFTEDGKIK